MSAPIDTLDLADALNNIAGRAEHARGAVRVLETALYHGHIEENDVRGLLTLVDRSLDLATDELFTLSESVHPSREVKQPPTVAHKVARRRKAK